MLSSFAAMSAPLRALIADFTAGNAPQALLLTGAEGIGKRTLARLLAQAVLCTDGQNRPCGACRACKRAQSGTHPDLLIPRRVAGKKDVNIDSVRALLDALSRNTLEDASRVVLLERADGYTPAMQNCLLKSIEEPDGRTCFILTADNERGVLPTVRSRCRVVRMQPWKDAQVKKVLEARGIQSDEAETLSQMCFGSIGQALALHEDEHFAALCALVDDTVFAVTQTRDVPLASAKYKNVKDDDATILRIIETKLHLLAMDKAGLASVSLPPRWRACPARVPAEYLQRVMDIRRMRASNVNFQALMEDLLLRISEDIPTWQQ